jgi:hypothetical protein
MLGRNLFRIATAPVWGQHPYVPHGTQPAGSGQKIVGHPPRFEIYWWRSELRYGTSRVDNAPQVPIALLNSGIQAPVMPPAARLTDG